MPTSKQKVLEYFGLDENDGRALNPLVDWGALAKSIEEPTKVAICHILDGKGKIVKRKGVPVRVYEEVPVENFRQQLQKRRLRFIGWF